MAAGERAGRQGGAEVQQTERENVPAVDLIETTGPRGAWQPEPLSLPKPTRRHLRDKEGPDGPPPNRDVCCSRNLLVLYETTGEEGGNSLVETPVLTNVSTSTDAAWRLLSQRSSPGGKSFQL